MQIKDIKGKMEESGIESVVSSVGEITDTRPVDNHKSNLRDVLRYFRENAESYQYINLTQLGIRINRDLLRAMQEELVEPEAETRYEYGLMRCGDKWDSHEWYLVKGEPHLVKWARLKELGGRRRLHTHAPRQDEYKIIQHYPHDQDYRGGLTQGSRGSVLSQKGIAFYPTHKKLSEAPSTTGKFKRFLRNERFDYAFALYKVIKSHAGGAPVEQIDEEFEKINQRFGIRFYRLTPETDKSGG